MPTGSAVDNVNRGVVCETWLTCSMDLVFGEVILFFLFLLQDLLVEQTV